MTVSSLSDHGLPTVRSRSTHSSITVHTQSDYGQLTAWSRSTHSTITVSSQSVHVQLTVRIRLFVTVLCLECDSQCGHFCRNTVKNTWLDLDWNVTVPMEQIGPISCMDCPGTEPVFCGYETRPSFVLIRRQVEMVNSTVQVDMTSRRHQIS